MKKITKLEVKNLNYKIFDSNNTAHERCALVLRNKLNMKLRVVETPNRHKNPKKYFSILVKDVETIKSDKEDVVAIIHTHHDNIDPSESDINGIVEGVIGIVYHLTTRTLTCYDSVGIKKTMRMIRK